MILLKRLIILSLVFLVLSIPLIKAEVVVITPQEEKQWLRHLIPLPHEIELPRKIIIKPADVSTLDVQKDLMENINKLKQAGKENISAITAWRSALGPEPWHQRVHDAIKGTERTVGDISQDIQGKYIF